MKYIDECYQIDPEYKAWVEKMRKSINWNPKKDT